MKWINFFVTLVMLGWIACDQPAQQSSESATDEAETTETTSEEESTTPRQGMSFTPDEIEALQNKFTYDPASGYYKHNLWAGRAPKRRTLTVDVYNNGSYILSSNYYGQSNLGHNRVIVGVGEESMTTERISTSNEGEHVVQTDEGSRFEINNYTNYRDNGIFEAIGKNPEAEVEIKFDSPRASSNAVPLPEQDKEAIVDAYLLSMLIRAGKVTIPEEEE